MAAKPTLPIPNYYEVLHLEHRFDPETRREIFASEERIRSAWRERVKNTHPSNSSEAQAEIAETFFRQVMEAGLCLLSAASREEWQEIGHEAYVLGSARQPFDADPLPDWIEVLVHDMLTRVEDWRGEFESSHAARVKCAAEIDLLPAFIPAERLVMFDVLDVAAVIEEALVAFPDLASLRTFQFDWVWRRNTWKSQGATVLGKAKALGKRDRELHPAGEARAPHGRIELALDHWIVMDPEERLRLVHHELLHFKVDGERLKVRTHDVEAFIEEVEAHGITSEALAHLVGAALKHPSLPDQLEEYGVELKGIQLSLFSAGGARAANG